jgi:hypothetical protein
MIRYATIAFISSLMITASVSAAGDAFKSKRYEEGYNAYAGAYLSNDCDFFSSNYMDLTAFSTKSKFTSISTGSNSGFTLECKDIEEFSLYMSTYTCDATTVTYRYGNIYDSSNLASQSTTFRIDGLMLMEASIEGLEVPIFENTCSYNCTEICYAELMGYGTCPEDELPYLECYMSECSNEDYIGNAVVSVSWTAPSDRSTQMTQRNEVVRSFGKESSSWSKTQGLTRDSLDVTITATLAGNDIFSSQPDSGYAQLSHTDRKEVNNYKFSNQEKYTRRMELLNN